MSLDGMNEALDFFKLAYLIEIAVVINLAFREIKFHKLDRELKKAVYKTLNRYVLNEAIKETAEYKQLQSLVDCSADKEINNSSKIKSVWSGRPVLKFFFNTFLRSRWALKIVNFFICTTISFLVLITASHYYKFHDEELLCFLNQYKFLLWEVLFCFLVMACAVPGIFIVLTAKTRKFFFVERDKENNKGVVGRLVNDLHNSSILLQKKNQETLNSTDKAASDFKAP